MLKAITFDFWNTIYDDYNMEKRNELRIKEIKKVLKQHGFDFSYQQINA